VSDLTVATAIFVVTYAVIISERHDGRSSRWPAGR
jgi:hypothetical protein